MELTNNAEKVMLELYNKGFNRKEVEQQLTTYETNNMEDAASKFVTNNKAIDENNVDFNLILRAGYDANKVDQRTTVKPVLNGVDRAENAILRLENDGLIEKNYSNYLAKYNTLMSAYAMNGDTVVLTPANKMALYFYTVDMLMNTKGVNIESITSNSYNLTAQERGVNLQDIMGLNRTIAQKHEILNKLRIELEKDLFKKTFKDYAYDKCLKALDKKASELENADAMAM